MVKSILNGQWNNLNKMRNNSLLVYFKNKLSKIKKQN